MGKVLAFILLLLGQFAGGPGPVENNLVRFGLPAILWAILFYIAWSRQRDQDLPREKLLVWGFGLAFLRELYMFAQMAWRLLDSENAEASCKVIQPFEHGLAMASMILVAGAFLRYILDDPMIARRYLQIGLGITLFAFIVTSLTWPSQLSAFPQMKFHHTWAAWLFHIPLSILMGVAVFLLWQKRGWLRNVVATALTLDLISELLLLLNYATDQAYNTVICPIGNSLHILAVPLLGYVYFHEQSIEKKQADEALMAYRDHLEELVDERTAELTTVNTQLKQEVIDRTQAEEALERITRRYELILESAGEGICGIDHQGEVTFVNLAAARMLGYAAAELVNRPSYTIWHRNESVSDPHPIEVCPIHQGYSQGIQRYGDDEYFWRRDGTGFPVRYFSNPVWERSELAGTVLVFQDITERKRSEAEIAQRNASLATQNTVAATLSQSLVIEDNLQHVLDMLRAEMEMEIGQIFLLSKTDNLIPYLAGGPLSPEEIQAFTADDCICQQTVIQALASKQAATNNLADSSLTDQLLCNYHPGILSLISVPLVSKGKVVGVLSLASRQLAVIHSYQLEMFTAIGQQIGMAIENARLYQDADSRAEELSRLHEASSYLTAPFDLDQVTNEIARQSAWLLRCQKAGVIRWEDRNNRFDLVSDIGLSQVEQQTLRDGLLEWAFLTKLINQPATIVIPDAFADSRLPNLLRNKLNPHAILIVPIWSSDNPREFILLMDMKASRQWRTHDIELIESLANRAAVALVNVNLHHQLEVAAALEERQRIAANMHDGLAQTLSLLGFRVDMMHELVEDNANPETENAIREIREVVTRASTEVRRSIANLQQAPRPRSALQDLLQGVLENIRSEDGPELHFYSETVPELYLLPEQTDQVLLLVQEALLNACRHAQAQSVSVRLEKVDENIYITIEDDGRGFDPDCPSQDSDHFGLSVMQVRAVRIGGQFQIDTSPGNGTKIRLSWIPESSGGRNSYQTYGGSIAQGEIQQGRLER